MSCNNYSNISKFGSNISTDSSNPITYCLNTELGNGFAHGSSAHTIGSNSRNCQMFMAQYCAQGWDDFCEVASKNSVTYYPNNLNNCNLPGDILAKEMTLGESLVRNTAKRKYLKKMINGDLVYEPFDPTVADSPMISYYVNSNRCNYGSGMAPVYEVNPQTIDADPVMNKILQKPQIAMDILINIYNSMTRNGTIGTLMGTKLGKLFQIHPYFQRKR